MNKKQLVAWGALPLLVLILPLAIPFSTYAGNLSTKDMDYVRQKAPDMIIHEEDLTYDRYKDSLKFLTEALDKYSKRKSKELGWESENIGVPNCLSIIKGYGLKTQRDLARLELKNARLNGATKATVATLEVKLKESEKRLKYFLEHNAWVD